MTRPTDGAVERALSEIEATARRWRFWVEASASRGGPEAAVVGVAVGPGLELVFDTLDRTRKCANLRRDPRVALAAWEGELTVQLEGLADEPEGAERERVKAVYFDVFPDGRERARWPGITWFRVRPRWARLTDFGVDPTRVVEWRARRGPGA